MVCGLIPILYRQEILASFGFERMQARRTQASFPRSLVKTARKSLNFRLIFLENDYRMVLCEGITGAIRPEAWWGVRGGLGLGQDMPLTGLSCTTTGSSK
jgi:hypothetical protein